MARRSLATTESSVRRGRRCRSLNASGWQIGNASLGSGEMMLDPAVEGSLSVGSGKPLPYRGRFRFVASAGDRFDVVNDVDVEGYLKGVLAKEMLHNWQLEAYEAQAIVARTYALYEARTGPPGRPFDLYPDQRSQVYGGHRRGISQEPPGGRSDARRRRRLRRARPRKNLQSLFQLLLRRGDAIRSRRVWRSPQRPPFRSIDRAPLRRVAAFQLGTDHHSEERIIPADSRLGHEPSARRAGDRPGDARGRAVRESVGAADAICRLRFARNAIQFHR